MGIAAVRLLAYRKGLKTRVGELQTIGCGLLALPGSLSRHLPHQPRRSRLDGDCFSIVVGSRPRYASRDVYHDLHPLPTPPTGCKTSTSVV